MNPQHWIKAEEQNKGRLMWAVLAVGEDAALIFTASAGKPRITALRLSRMSFGLVGWKAVIWNILYKYNWKRCSSKAMSCHWSHIDYFFLFELNMICVNKIKAFHEGFPGLPQDNFQIISTIVFNLYFYLQYVFDILIWFLWF